MAIDFRGIRVISKGFNVNGTQVYDAEGRDITAELKIRKMVVTMEVGNVTKLEMECFPSEIDVTIMSDDIVTRVAFPKRYNEM